MNDANFSCSYGQSKVLSSEAPDTARVTGINWLAKLSKEEVQANIITFAPRGPDGGDDGGDQSAGNDNDNGDDDELDEELLAMLRVRGPAHSGNFDKYLRRGLHLNADVNSLIQACLRPREGCVIYAYVKVRGGSADFVRDAIATIKNERPPTPNRITISIQDVNANLDQHWRATEQAIKAAGCPVFVRYKRLVQPIWRWIKVDNWPDSEEKYVLAAELEPYNPSAVIRHDTTSRG